MTIRRQKRTSPTADTPNRRFVVMISENLHDRIETMWHDKAMQSRSDVARMAIEKGLTVMQGELDERRNALLR